MKTAALLIGLREIDPTKNADRWDGKVGGEGCENDVTRVRSYLDAIGFGDTILELRTAQATKQAVLNAIRALGRPVPAPDLFFLFFSGHGVRIDDNSPQPDELRDEALVCFDGFLLDDELTSEFEQFDPNTRSLVITDCCNSEIIDRDRVTETNLGPILHIGAAAAGDTTEGGTPNSPFTDALMTELERGADAPADYKTLIRRVGDALRPDGLFPIFGTYGPRAARRRFLATQPFA